MIGRVLVGAVAVLVLSIGVVYGGEDAHGEEASARQLVYPAVNFLVFAYIVRRYGWPAVRNYLQERQSRVVEEHARGKAVLEQAQARLAAAEARSGDLEEERDRLRHEIIGGAERVRDRVLHAAEESARRISRDAELVMAQERRRGLQRVRLELAGATMREAEKMLARRISERDQQRFRQLLFEEVGER